MANIFSSFLGATQRCAIWHNNQRNHIALVFLRNKTTRHTIQQHATQRNDGRKHDRTNDFVVQSHIHNERVKLGNAVKPLIERFKERVFFLRVFEKNRTQGGRERERDNAGNHHSNRYCHRKLAIQGTRDAAHKRHRNKYGA